MASAKARPRAKVPARWVRNESDREAVRRGYYFDPEAGEFVCDFIERFCRQSKGKWAGQPIELIDWQRDFVMPLYSWKRPDGRRRFTHAYLEVAKKNGKSTLLSGLALYHLIADGEGGPEVYINACTREQASIIYREAASMVEKSPDLQKRLDLVPSSKRIVDPSNDGFILANSAEAPSKDGPNASLVLFDELHTQRTRDLVDVFAYAGAARDQPLAIDITTAGEDTFGVWHERRVLAENIAKGLVVNLEFLGVVYRALPEDDIDDPETWRKANPSLGVTIPIDRFQEDLAKAKETPTELANFKRRRLNIVAGGNSQFVSPERWKSCEGFREVHDGADCFGGLDVSSTLDLTSLELIFPDGSGGFDVRSYFWHPAEGLVEKEKADGSSYRYWAEQGFLNLCEGAEIDYAAVRRVILEAKSRWNLKALGVDPMHAKQLMQELLNQHGVNVVNVPQGMMFVSPPTKKVEALVATRKIRHGGHPVLAWCASNAIAYRDGNDNVRLHKKRSRGRIDGMSALVNAVAMTIDQGEEKPVDKVYNRRGPVWVSL